jgi:uncharacterized phage protein gp47/JayE
MPFFPRTENEIIKDSLERMSSNTNLTQLSPGGKVRFLISTTAREQAGQQALFDANLLQPYIKYSEGKFLDFFGDMLNLPRVEASHAESTGENFMFYVSSGNFGDINNGSSFVIPSGTVVHTVPFEGEILTPGIELQPTISYSLTSDVTCLPGESFVYAPIRANIEGEESTVPRNVLTAHEFTNYLGGTGLLCTNRYSIDNGTVRETDDAYKYRLQNIFRARSMGVLASIRLAALSVPGVSDIVEVNCEQGPGTYGIYVQSTAPTPSPQLIEEVSQAVALVSTYGVRPFVSAPQTLGLELVAAVQWSPRATTADIAQGYANMRNSIEDRLNITEIGEAVDFAALVDLILSSSNYALRMGRNKPNKFEETYVYKADPSNTSVSIRSILIGDSVTPLYNERVLLETGSRYRGIHFITF